MKNIQTYSSQKCKISFVAPTKILHKICVNKKRKMFTEEVSFFNFTFLDRMNFNVTDVNLCLQGSSISIGD